MIEKSRIVIDLSMSVLERTEAGKLIKTYEKEYIKPYRYIDTIKKIAGYIFFFAATFTLIMMVIQIIGTQNDNGLTDQIRVLNIILLAMFGLSLLLFNIQDILLKKGYEKNETIEKTDNELTQRVKLNLYFIENITNSVTGRVYREHIKTSYRKGGFIFIHMRNDNCIVIPDRVFTSKRVVIEVADFIHAQIVQIKKRLGNLAATTSVVIFEINKKVITSAPLILAGVNFS
ncbi:TPA: hypothetical protein U2I11_004669 [Citrobacter koseri]|uniref:Uncharacterized protein n=1 Tax=Citrobacter koseri TaxID=545 RepID=A0AAW4EF75_CITKO|nr:MULTISPECIES: hypothetical protein [Citrobacter]EJK7983607.1 hypothetical protein [Citrobacter koseri]EJK7984458.1 hypothetical protein [Citrobacter koseri]EKV7914732.1 hypothetical protein [Citrobacter koseri]EKV7917073.1 hypothetical protein [Citrobacter koseri]EKW5609558.1 hypothetical protein [Citrobacter koseri]